MPWYLGWLALASAKVLAGLSDSSDGQILYFSEISRSTEQARYLLYRF
jgi:hypothetical protein